MTSRSRLARLSLLTVLAGGLSACTNLASFEMGDLPVPPDSPVAAAAREAARYPGDWPTFADIPRKSEEAPAPAVIARNEAGLKEQVDALRTEAARTPEVTPAQLDAFAAQQRAAVAGVEAPGENSAAEIEAFARAARARATPPPPPP